MQNIHGGDIYRNQVSVDFSVNVNPLGIPREVKEALYGAVEKCFAYPDMMTEELKNAVADMLGIPAEYLLFGNGASELFMGIVHAVRPKKILIPVPSFYGYEYAAAAAGGECVYYPLREENQFLPEEDFLEALTEDLDMVFLANPNNPTGRALAPAYLKRLFTICSRKHILVVLDECFVEFCSGERSMLQEIEEYDNVLLVRAFTKIYGIPGVRLGYAVCSSERLLEKIKGQLPEWNVSTFAQEAGIACTKQKAFLEETVAYVRKERQFLKERLEEAGIWVFESDTNFLLLYSELELDQELLKQGILIRSCENFRGLSKGYYRIAVKSRQENERLLTAVEMLIRKGRVTIHSQCC